MSYAERHGRPYGYATYAANRAPPPGGPRKVNASVTTAYVGPSSSRRSGSATQFGLLEYDSHDFTRGGTSRSASEDAWRGTHSTGRASGAKRSGTKSSAVARRSAAELHAAARREAEAAVAASSDNPQVSPESSDGGHAVTAGGHLVATPVVHSDGAHSIAVHDVSAPNEVAVEYTTRILRRDDLDVSSKHLATNTTVTRAGSPGRAVETSGQLVPQFGTPEQEQAVTEHFKERHPIAMTPVPVPISFDGQQQDQFDRIERGLDRTTAASDASTAAVQKLSEDVLHRDAVRRASEEERDVANAANVERIVEAAATRITESLDSSNDGRSAAIRASFENVTSRLAETVEKDGRRVMSLVQQTSDGLAKAVDAASTRTASTASNDIVSRVAGLLLTEGNATGAPLETRLRHSAVEIHRGTVETLRADFKLEIAEALRMLTGDRAAAEAVTEAESSRRLDDAEQRITSTLLDAGSRGRDQQSAAILQAVESHSTTLNKGMQSGFTSALESARTSSDAVQQHVGRELTRLRTDLMDALDEAQKRAEAESEKHGSQAARRASEDKQLRGQLTSMESALERYQRDTVELVDGLATRVTDKVTTAVLDGAPARVGAAVTATTKSSLDQAVNQLTQNFDRATKRSEVASEAAPAAVAREVTQQLPSAVVAALRPVLEAELGNVSRNTRDTSEAQAQTAISRIERSLETSLKGLNASIDRTVDTSVKAAASDAGRDTTAAVEATVNDRFRSLAASVTSLHDELSRSATHSSDAVVSRVIAHIDSANDAATRNVSEKVASSASATAARAAADAVTAARQETQTAVDGAIARALETRVGGNVGDIVRRSTETLRELIEADRRQREPIDRQRHDELLAALKSVASQLQRFQSDEEGRDGHATSERQRLNVEIAAVRSAQTVSRIRDAYEAGDEESARAMGDVLDHAQRAREKRLDASAETLRELRDFQQRSTRERDAAVDRFGDFAGAVVAASSSLEQLRAEREAIAQDVAKARDELEALAARRSRVETELEAAEDRRARAVEAAAAAERAASESQAKLLSYREKEAAAKGELVRAQSQVSSVATLREVMLRDVQRLNQSGLTSVSTHGAPSVARSVSRQSPSSTPVPAASSATNPYAPRSSDPHE